jgi:uncharacterized protein YeaO (DUF488 family)
MRITVKRVYAPPSDADGLRILVDRLWPRGLTKDAARLDAWMRDLAPSNDLRRWYGHDPAKWAEFQARYAAELDALPDKVAELAALIHGKPATFLYSSTEERLNNAVALADYVSRRHKP